MASSSSSLKAISTFTTTPSQTPPSSSSKASLLSFLNTTTSSPISLKLSHSFSPSHLRANDSTLSLLVTNALKTAESSSSSSSNLTKSPSSDSKPTILVSEKLGEAGLEVLRAFGNLECAYNLTPEELCLKISACDALIVRSGTKVTRQVFEASKGRLKVVGRAGVGIDNVDLQAATEFGCLVVNAPTANTVAAAEHGIALLTSMAPFLRKTPKCSWLFSFSVYPSHFPNPSYDAVFDFSGRKMSGGGVSIGRARGENRFYNPPPIRERQQQQLLQRQKLEQEKKQQRQQQVSVSEVVESEDCATSHSSGSGREALSEAANLDRFIEFTTPLARAQFLPKTSIRGWRTHEPESHPYFVLGDLWESFKEWSAYGAGVPLLLNGSDSVIQYYVPYLSAIQLYVDPSKPPTRIRRHGDDSDAESSRETSSDGSSDYGAERRINGVVDNAWSRQNIADVNGLGWNRVAPRDKPLTGSSSDESEICNPPGQLVFQYLEHDQPFGREPLADKIQVLASQFPELRTYKSCDLSPSSWISVAWYPIYRIPTGPTLQSLDACFLTFHSLSTPLKGTSTDRLRPSSARPREIQNADFKLSLPTFGLASYKFKGSFWNPNGVYESQKANSLLRAAENWLRLLHVDHPDFNFFVSHNTPRR